MLLDRVELNRALAKAVAFAQCGKPVDAEIWAARLVAMLGAAHILNPERTTVRSVLIESH